MCAKPYYQYEIGQRVLYKRKKNEAHVQEVTIEDRYSTPYMNMYSLNIGGNVGECYLLPIDAPIDSVFPIDTLSDRDIYKDIVTHSFGGLLSASKGEAKEVGDELLSIYNENGETTFFKPNKQFAKWLLERFGKKLFIDVGCGDGTLVDMLMRLGGKGMGMDLYYRSIWELKRLKFMQDPKYGGMLHFIEDDATTSNYIRDANPDVFILLFCRPCHGYFVEDTIENAPSGTEVYYITKPENIDKYNDLGSYWQFAEQLEHEGSSVDDEVVFYFKKP